MASARRRREHLPSEDNLRTRVEQRGTDSEGVDFAQRARGEDRRMVANTVVVGHAGGKGASRNLASYIFPKYERTLWWGRPIEQLRNRTWGYSTDALSVYSMSRCEVEKMTFAPCFTAVSTAA